MTRWKFYATFTWLKIYCLAYQWLEGLIKSFFYFFFFVEICLKKTSHGSSLYLNISYEKSIKIVALIAHKKSEKEVKDTTNENYEIIKHFTMECYAAFYPCFFSSIAFRATNERILPKSHNINH